MKKQQQTSTMSKFPKKWVSQLKTASQSSLIKSSLESTSLTPAAVLLPFLAREEDVTLVLTRRSQELPTHKGEIALPGGKMAKADKSVIETALRETHEEIGIGPEQIAIQGQLSPHQTGTGFLITPITALVTPPYHFQKQVSEVEEIFEVPLTHICDLNNYHQQSAWFAGKKREFWVLPYKNYKIWGATAAILIDLAERLSKAQS